MNEKQTQAIMLLASGKTGKETAEQLQVTPKTISTWRACPEFRAELNSHLLDIKQANSERLRSLSMQALNTVEEIMKDEGASHKERLLAAFKVLELGKVSTEEIGSKNPEKLRRDDALENMFF